MAIFESFGVVPLLSPQSDYPREEIAPQNPGAKASEQARRTAYRIVEALSAGGIPASDIQVAKMPSYKGYGYDILVTNHPPSTLPPAVLDELGKRGNLRVLLARADMTKEMIQEIRGRAIDRRAQYGAFETAPCSLFRIEAVAAGPADPIPY